MDWESLWKHFKFELIHHINRLNYYFVALFLYLRLFFCWKNDICIIVFFANIYLHHCDVIKMMHTLLSIHITVFSFSYKVSSALFVNRNAHVLIGFETLPYFLYTGRYQTTFWMIFILLFDEIVVHKISNAFTVELHLSWKLTPTVSVH